MHGVPLSAICDKLSASLSAGRSCQGRGTGLRIAFGCGPYHRHFPRPSMALFSTRSLSERASTRPQHHAVVFHGYTLHGFAALCRHAAGVKSEAVPEATCLLNMVAADKEPKHA